MKSRGRCPGCDQHIHKRRGDTFLRCYQCGWTAGVPVLRWVTHNHRLWGSHHWKQTATRWSRMLALGVLAIIAVGLIVGGVQSFGGIGALPPEDQGGGDNPGGAEDVGSQYNETKVEALIFENVNSIRSTESLNEYQYNTRAAAASESHAIDMAQNNYFSHTSQDGETQGERYAFCDGGENNAQTWVEKNVITQGDVNKYTTEEELAEGVVSRWMDSEGHREKGVLGEWWESAGVGVAITDSGKVYVSMGFCT